MAEPEDIRKALDKIFEGISDLRDLYPSLRFTIDGRLVGDIGEMIAALNYDIELDQVQQADHDGTTSDGARVQVKATFKNSLTFKTVPELYLGFRLNEDGSFEEIYNGPPDAIIKEYSHRKDFGKVLLSFPVGRLRELSESVKEDEKVRRRESDT